MLPPLDVRRARLRRWTLVVLAACAFAMAPVARLVPRAAPFLVPPGATTVALAGIALLAALLAALRPGRDVLWTRADDLAWAIGLLSLSVLGALGAAPVTLGTALFGVAAVLLAARVPSVRLVLVTCACALLGVVVRATSGAGGGALWAVGAVSALVVLAHVVTARATQALVYALAEREALRSERRALPRPSEPTARAVAPTRQRATLVPREAQLEVPADEENGWEGLVERLRSSVESLCGPAGVSTSVHAEVGGLAPPSGKMRTNLLRIAQEAAHHALRDTSPTAIAVTLRRGDGGLLLEVQDDGRVGETIRTRRGLASVRGRAATLGGSAELRRADAGWVMRVKIPCEQLN